MEGQGKKRNLCTEIKAITRTQTKNSGMKKSIVQLESLVLGCQMSEGTISEVETMDRTEEAPVTYCCYQSLGRRQKAEQ